MVYAENTQTSDFKLKHTNYGKMTVKLLSDGTSNFIVPFAFTFDAPTIHGLIMWITWTIFGLVMIASNRWFSYLSDKM